MIPAPLVLLLACTGGKDPAATDSGAAIDCASPSTWYVDGDGDGFGAGEATGQGCVRPDGQVANADDCDDADPGVNPAADEVCNGIDDDCDGDVDPATAAGTINCWQDADGDGYGDPTVEQQSCACDDGWVNDDTDCDDMQPSAHPGAEEVLYDGIDQDCLGLAGEYDRDGDGYDWVDGEGVDGTDCNDDDATIHPDVWDDCEDDVDQDCDGVVDECGFASVTDADDAWLRVYREPDDEEDDKEGQYVATFGHSLVHAGDADGDGNQELVGPIVAMDGTGTLQYVLIEIPQRTGGGDVELEAVTAATWDMPDDGCLWTEVGWRYDEGIVANQDLDGDGIQDYLFLSNGGPSDGSTPEMGPIGRLDLWSGPADGAMSLDDAVTFEYPGSKGVRFYETMEFMPSAWSSGDWGLAVDLWPVDNADEGTVHPGIAFLSGEHFDGTAAIADAPVIWSSPPYETSMTMEADDLNGDGIDDLLTSAQRYRSDLPPGQAYVFQGPFDEDRSMDDADLVINGAQEGDEFGETLTITSDTDGDGIGQIAVVNPNPTTLPASVLFYKPHASDWPTTLSADAAGARIDGNDDEIPIVNAMPRMVGDPDADGVDELAVPIWGDYGNPEPVFGERVLLFEPPNEGVLGFADADARLTTDEDVDPQAGFGVSILGGVDYDGDDWSDIVVGEYYWDRNPAKYYHPYGRFLIYRGEVGAE